MWPFHYYHTYIPLVPTSLADCLEAPTPYLMGVRRSMLGDVMRHLRGCVLVDLDSGETRDMSFVDERHTPFALPPDAHTLMLAWLAALVPLPPMLSD